MGHEKVESSGKSSVKNRLTPVLLVRFTFAFACLKKRAKKKGLLCRLHNNQIDLPQDDLMSFSAIFCNRPRSGGEGRDTSSPKNACVGG